MQQSRLWYCPQTALLSSFQRLFRALQIFCPVQSSKAKLGTRENSRVLLVTIVRSLAMPCAAIIVSYEPIGVPRDSRYARSSPNRLASSDVNGSMVNAERNKRMLDLVCSVRTLFAAPYSSSPAVTDETQISFGCI